MEQYTSELYMMTLKSVEEFTRGFSNAKNNEAGMLLPQDIIGMVAGHIYKTPKSIVRGSTVCVELNNMTTRIVVNKSCNKWSNYESTANLIAAALEGCHVWILYHLFNGASIHIMVQCLLNPSNGGWFKYLDRGTIHLLLHIIQFEYDRCNKRLDACITEFVIITLYRRGLLYMIQEILHIADLRVIPPHMHVMIAASIGIDNLSKFPGIACTSGDITEYIWYMNYMRCELADGIIMLPEPYNGMTSGYKAALLRFLMAYWRLNVRFIMIDPAHIIGHADRLFRGTNHCNQVDFTL